MKTAEFDYDLPPELIAQQPLPQRDHARMLVVRRREGVLEHCRFTDFPSCLEPQDLVVVNDTKVLPARILGRKADTGGRVEILLLEETRAGIWDVLLHASRRPKPGSLIKLGNGEATAELLQDGEKGRAVVRVVSELPLSDLLQRIGTTPLPPYINRSAASPAQHALDRERYQTVYARQGGAVAAPTAGLHFTTEILGELERRGVRRTAVTLHVGLGTFRPVDAKDVADHHMEGERYTIPVEAAKEIEAAKERGGRIVAVGTTTVRTLESVAAEHGRVVACEGRTELFIHPPYTFRAVDVLLTNFHLPRSTLLMMISALAGKDLVMRAYRDAVERKYRFYSYGDCMLIV